jgi:hypothetical protein
MKRNLVVIGAALVALLALFAACGGDGSGTNTPTMTGTSNGQGTQNGTGPTPRATRTGAPTPVGAEPLPCTLLSNSDVEALIGSVTTAQPQIGGCDYTGDTGMLSVHLEPKAADVASATASLTTIAGAGAESASAGDGAYFVGDMKIVARKGLYVFTLTASKSAKDALLTLARAAAASLPAS